MIYTFYGNDFKKLREKMGDLVSALKKKKPDLTWLKIDSENFTKELFEEAIFGQGLFSDKLLVQIDLLLSDKNASDLIIERIEEMKLSPNIFLIHDNDLSEGVEVSLKENSEKFIEGNLREEFKPVLNSFKLADLIGLRDRKNSWIELMRLFEEDVVPEEIHGTIFWLFKNMILSSEPANGLKPFVLNKAKSFKRNYSDEELKFLMNKLVSIFHDAHRGGANLPLNLALERFVLAL